MSSSRSQIALVYSSTSTGIDTIIRVPSPQLGVQCVAPNYAPDPSAFANALCDASNAMHGFGSSSSRSSWHLALRQQMFLMESKLLLEVSLPSPVFALTESIH
jgi:hypothetical protein